MNKWIEQKSYEYSDNRPSHRNCFSCCDTDGPHENAFTAGAQAALTKVREIIEATRGNDWKDTTPLSHLEFVNKGREILRKEILEALGEDP